MRFLIYGVMVMAGVCWGVAAYSLVVQIGLVRRRGRQRGL